MAMVVAMATIASSSSSMRLVLVLVAAILVAAAVVGADKLATTDTDAPPLVTYAPSDAINPPVPLPVASDPAIPALVSWLTISGVDMSMVSIADIETKGRGLLATQDIPANTTIFTIPLSIIVTTDTIVRQNQWTPDRHPTDMFALWLAYNRRNNQSEHLSYLQSLPSFVPLPLFYSSPLTNETRGTVLEVLLSERRSIAYNSYNTLTDDIKALVQKGDYLWAISIVWSRSFSIAKKVSASDGGKGSWVSKAALVPLVDLINTGNDTVINTKCKTHRDGTVFECKATQPISQGSELLLSYGQRSNSQLLHDYGFAQFTNQYDYTSIELPSPKANKLLNDTREVLFRKGEVQDSLVRELSLDQPPTQFRLTAPPTDIGDTVSVTNITLSAIIPNDTLGWARLNVIDHYDCIELVAYEMISAAQSGQRISANNDVRAAKLLIKQIRAALRKFPTKIEADYEALHTKELAQSNPPLFWITLVRYYEKSILKDIQSLLEERMPSLSLEAEHETLERKRRKEAKRKELVEKKRREAEKKAEKERRRKLSEAKTEDSEDAEDFRSIDAEMARELRKLHHELR